jgi:hypothetical protein
VPSIRDRPSVRIGALLLLIGLAASIIVPVVIAAVREFS